MKHILRREAKTTTEHSLRVQHKKVGRRLASGAFAMLFVLGMVLQMLPVQRASADNQPPWYDTHGNVVDGGPKVSDFEFVNSQTLRYKDGTLYKSASLPSFDIANGHPLRNFYFWPDDYQNVHDDGHGGQYCFGGLVVAINSMRYIPLEAGSSNNQAGCFDGSDSPPNHFQDENSNLGNHVYSMGDMPENMKPQFSGLFDWANEDTLEFTGFGTQTHPITGVAAQNIADFLRRTHESRLIQVRDATQSNNSADGVFYSNSECQVDGKEYYKAFIAVSPAKLPDKLSEVYVLHTDADSKTSGGYHLIKKDWDGGASKCLFAGKDLGENPLITGSNITPDDTSSLRQYANSPENKNASDTQSGGNATAGASGTSPGNAGGDSQNSADACQSDGGALAWIMCAIIDGLARAVGGLYGDIIMPILQTDRLTGDCSGDKTNTCNANQQSIYSAWNDFRVIANILLVIGLLVIVFGESIGGGLVDAYTAKKALPRVLIAAVLINISYYLAAMAVDVTNILGVGLMDLLLKPFGASGFAIHLHGVTGSIGSALGMAGLVAGGWAAFQGGGELLEFMWAFVLLPAFLIFIAIMVTIFIRRALITILIVLSPVAFALYCLPNTEKYFKQWWDTFVRALLVFPIITVIFAAGQISSMVISGTAGNAFSGALANIIAVIALIVPLVLIPFAFRIAGGIIGKVHETLNNYGKRGHQAILGSEHDAGSWRNRVKRRAAARYAEKDLSPTAVGTRLNPTTLLGSRRDIRRARLGAKRNMFQSVYGKQGMGAAMYEANKDDSNITGDLALYGSGAESRAAALEDLDKGRIDRATYEQRLFSSAAADRIGREPAMRRRALMNPATIGYSLKPGEEGWNQADKAMREISGFHETAPGVWVGGDEGTYRSLMNEFQYVAKSAAGRTDLSGNVDGGEYNGYRAWTQIGMYEHGHGKGYSIQGSAQYFNGLWDRAQDPDTLSEQDIDNFTKHLSAEQKSTMSEADIRRQAQSNALDAVGIFSRELDNMGDAASGGVRDEAARQNDALKAKGGSLLESIRESNRVKKLARGYDREEMNRMRAAGHEP